jgi:hypothetical protein
MTRRAPHRVQTVNNFVSNGVQHSPVRGTVRVTASIVARCTRESFETLMESDHAAMLGIDATAAAAAAALYVWAGRSSSYSRCVACLSQVAAAPGENRAAVVTATRSTTS